MRLKGEIVAGETSLTVREAAVALLDLGERAGPSFGSMTTSVCAATSRTAVSTSMCTRKGSLVARRDPTIAPRARIAKLIQRSWPPLSPVLH